ncbi:conserved exported hypothetical protein [Alteromonas alvinellae]|nr:hypothetical protein [Gammaproteobacteria bacterium]
MLKRNLQLIALSTTLALAAGCSSTPKTNATDMGMTLPSWVTTPTVESGLAASSCVAASNSFSMDKTQAATMARTELAAQLDARVSSLQEQYAQTVSSASSSTTNTDFSTTTTQFVNQALQGSKVTKVDYAQMGQQKNVCALVTVSEDNAKRLFERVINSAPTKLSPEDETLLYLNFLKSENQL